MRRDGLTPFPSNSNRRYNIEMNTSPLQHALMDALAKAKDEFFGSVRVACWFFNPHVQTPMVGWQPPHPGQLTLP